MAQKYRETYSEAMTIVPDSKDWTWVLAQPCPECSFDSGAPAYEDIPALILDNARSWPKVLAREDVRVRPDEATWSALEYAAHVRDVFRIFTERLELILAEDNPTFANWDQDATAIADRYSEQDPETIAVELMAAAERAASAYGAVASADRSRTALRSNGSQFTVESLARYFVHDVIHHRHDVAGQRGAPH